MGARADHVRALQNERDMYSRRPNHEKRRLAEIDAELAKYASEPGDPAQETAVPGPVSSGRKARGKRTPPADAQVVSPEAVAAAEPLGQAPASDALEDVSEVPHEAPSDAPAVETETAAEE